MIIIFDINFILNFECLLNDSEMFVYFLIVCFVCDLINGFDILGFICY